MKKLALLAIAGLFTFCWSGNASAALANTVAELPFVFEKGLVILPIKIKKDVPVDVILATGNEFSLMETGLLDKYSLKAYYTGVGIITGRHSDQIISFTTVPELRVGDIRVTSQQMRLGSLAGASKSVGREIFAVLGADFFKGRVVQFDFAKRLVRFFPESPSVEPKDTGPEKNARAPIVLPIRTFSERLTLPVVDVLIDGKKIKTLIDTGAVPGLSLSPSSGKELGLMPLPENSGPRVDKIGSLRFGDFEVNAVPVVLFAKGSDFYRDLKEFEAIVGTGMLQNFIVTFDFRKHVVIMERL